MTVSGEMEYEIRGREKRGQGGSRTLMKLFKRVLSVRSSMSIVRTLFKSSWFKSIYLWGMHEMSNKYMRRADVNLSKASLFF